MEELKTSLSFIEMHVLIQERNEKILEDKINMVKTDQHFYIRSGYNWVEKEIPPPEEKQGEVK